MNEPGTHKLTEALKPTPEENALSDALESGPPKTQPQDSAEQTRRAEQSRSHGVPERDEYLTNVGRGQQTHG